MSSYIIIIDQQAQNLVVEKLRKVKLTKQKKPHLTEQREIIILVKPTSISMQAAVFVVMSYF